MEDGIKLSGKSNLLQNIVGFLNSLISEAAQETFFLSCMSLTPNAIDCAYTNSMTQPLKSRPHQRDLEMC